MQVTGEALGFRSQICPVLLEIPFSGLRVCGCVCVSACADASRRVFGGNTAAEAAWKCGGKPRSQRSLRPGAEKKPPPALPVPLSAGHYTERYVAMATQTLIIHTLPLPGRQIFRDL